MMAWPDPNAMSWPDPNAMAWPDPNADRKVILIFSVKYQLPLFNDFFNSTNPDMIWNEFI